MQRNPFGSVAAPNHKFVLVGGAGFLGSAISRVLRALGLAVTIVDRQPPPDSIRRLGVDSVQIDLLADEIILPEGEVVILTGPHNPHPRWLWTLPLDTVFTTARLLPALQGRTVTLLSSVAVYGSARPPLTEESRPQLPWSASQLGAWCEAVCWAARQPVHPWRVAALCRELVEADPTGRWLYGLVKLAQEELIRHAVPESACTILRLADGLGFGQAGIVTHFIRRAQANLPLPITDNVQHTFLDAADVGYLLASRPGPGVLNVGRSAISQRELAGLITMLCGSTSRIISSSRESTIGALVDTSKFDAMGIELPSLHAALAKMIQSNDPTDYPLFTPPLPIVIPPRPARPDEVADRQQAALWSGRLKSGNQWTRRLEEELRAELQLTPADKVLLTTSGTEALRLAVVATAGVALPGQVALLPSFTYPATAEVLLQLGYRLHYVEVDPQSWTLSPAAVKAALAREQVAVVVCVDTFGNPCDYQALTVLCAEMGVPLVADSAASIGSRYQGHPVGAQADAHAYSMSFAKLFSTGGAGGAVVLRGEACHKDISIWQRSALMDELHGIAGLDQMAILEELVARRRAIAEIYAAALRSYPQLTGQVVAAGNRHSYVHWVMRVAEPKQLAAHLTRLGIETRDYFRGLHLRGNLSAPLSLPVTEALDAEVIALPISSEMTEEEAERVVLGLEIALGEMMEMPHLQPATLATGLKSLA